MKKFIYGDIVDFRLSTPTGSGMPFHLELDIKNDQEQLEIDISMPFDKIQQIKELIGEAEMKAMNYQWRL